MKKIYPVDWRMIHPEERPMATDGYYTELANRVMEVLVADGIGQTLTRDEDIMQVAIRLTGYFEDLCSETGLWGVVNEVCKERYGKLLPFYNMREYYPGEPNIQDIQLLLWDTVLPLLEDGFMNPENKGIALSSRHIYELFYDEYELAPETDELKEYLSGSTLSNDYWAGRNAIEWFSLHSYLSLRSSFELTDSLQGITRDENFEGAVYTEVFFHAFTDRHNLLSITAAEWLSRATKGTMALDDRYMELALYEILERGKETFRVRDMVTGEELDAETDAFEVGWVEGMGQRVDKIIARFVGFNGRYFQFGGMIDNLPATVVEKSKEVFGDRLRMKDNAKYCHELFQKNVKEPIVFLKGVDEVTDFYVKYLGVKSLGDFRSRMEAHLRDNAEDGIVAMMSDPEAGYLTISRAVRAIKAPNNPYYDQEYAKQNAYELMVMPHAIDYYAVIYLWEHGMLDDASIPCVCGYEYGKHQVQEDGRFILDYFFAERKELLK